jgi:hypothetical protein
LKRTPKEKIDIDFLVDEFVQNTEKRNLVGIDEVAPILCSLTGYKNDTPASQLNRRKDYLQQECKRCHNKINKLISYKHLDKKD